MKKKTLTLRSYSGDREDQNTDLEEENKKKKVQANLKEANGKLKKKSLVRILRRAKERGKTERRKIGKRKEYCKKK